MGPDRFKCVLSVARSLLIQEGYIASGRLPESVDRPVPLSTDPRVAQAVVRRSAVLNSAGKSPCSSPVRARASAASGDKSVQRRVHSSLATTDDQKETNSAAKPQASAGCRAAGHESEVSQMATAAEHSETEAGLNYLQQMGRELTRRAWPTHDARNATRRSRLDVRRRRVCAVTRTQRQGSASGIDGNKAAAATGTMPDGSCGRMRPKHSKGETASSWLAARVASVASLNSVVAARVKEPAANPWDPRWANASAATARAAHTPTMGEPAAAGGNRRQLKSPPMGYAASSGVNVTSVLKRRRPELPEWLAQLSSVWHGTTDFRRAMGVSLVPPPAASLHLLDEISMEDGEYSSSETTSSKRGGRGVHTPALKIGARKIPKKARPSASSPTASVSMDLS